MIEYPYREGYENMRSIIHYHMDEYGYVKVKLSEVLDGKGISRNKLSTLTGIKYDVVDRYYKASSIELVDLNFIAKVCFVLDCTVSDLLEYYAPTTSP